MKEDAKLIVMRTISRLQAGPDLDKLVAHVVFGMDSEPCDQTRAYHMKGALHYRAQISGQMSCASPVPVFSTDWAFSKIMLEWLCEKFPGVEIVWDCNRWSCNVNWADKDSCWFRLSAVAGASGMQEAICKASLLSLVSPQEMPLDFRPRISDRPRPRKPARRTRRKR